MNSVDKEQQRLDAIINKRALGLHTSTSGTRTRRWPASERAALSSPPPVPPRSPTPMTTAPTPALPPRERLVAVAPASAIRSVSLDSKPRGLDDEAHVQEPDDQYRAKCEAQRLDKYISGEWRLARALRASNGGGSSGSVKTRTPVCADTAAEQAERQHKESLDVAATKSSTLNQAKETTGTSLVNAISELAYLLDTLGNGAQLGSVGFDAIKALVIVQKAKAISDLVPDATCGGIAEDTAALVTSVARFVKGWRDGNGDVASSTALTKSANSIASQATTLQHQLRRQIVVIADA